MLIEGLPLNLTVKENLSYIKRHLLGEAGLGRELVCAFLEKIPVDASRLNSNVRDSLSQIRGHLLGESGSSRVKTYSSVEHTIFQIRAGWHLCQ